MHAGHETRTAYDGVEAIEVASDFRPEVVLLDLGMPNLSGLDVCAHLRAQFWAEDILIISQTGWGQEEDRSRTHAAGFDHHLVKPIRHGVLMKLFAQFVAQQKVVSEGRVPATEAT